MSENDPRNCLPDADQYLVDCFELLGRCENSGMGQLYLKWSELESFTNKSGYTLDGWQSEQIIGMSRSYCNFLNKAKEHDCKAPYRDDLDSIDFYVDEVKEMRDKVDDSWDSMIRFFNAK